MMRGLILCASVIATGCASIDAVSGVVGRRWGWSPEIGLTSRVGASPVNYETATFTVNRITVRQQFGAYAPLNTTSEFVVTLRYRF